MSRIILPVLVMVALILVVTGVEPWIIFLVIAAMLAPIGMVGMRDLKKIEKRDFDISTFLKSLGTIAGTAEATLTVALEHLDKKSVASLEEPVNRLQKRLINGINPKICWHYFLGETGSELVNRFTTVFLDAIGLGGNPIKIGEVTALSSLRIAILRAKRKLVSSGFINLVIPLHATMSGVLLFIYRIMYSFNQAAIKMMEAHSTEVGGAMEQMPAGIGFFDLGGGDIAFIGTYVTIIILVLTIANILASKFAVGGSNYTLCLYASILFFVSAIVLYVIPIFANNLFSMEMG
jgi:flagellar protein FlaJ